MSERKYEEAYTEERIINAGGIGGWLKVAALYAPGIFTPNDSFIELSLTFNEDNYALPTGWAHKDVLLKWEPKDDRAELVRKAINLFDETKRLIAKNGWPEHGLDTLF